MVSVARIFLVILVAGIFLCIGVAAAVTVPPAECTDFVLKVIAVANMAAKGYPEPVSSVSRQRDRGESGSRFPLLLQALVIVHIS